MKWTAGAFGLIQNVCGSASVLTPPFFRLGVVHELVDELVRLLRREAECGHEWNTPCDNWWRQRVLSLDRALALRLFLRVE